MTFEPRVESPPFVEALKGLVGWKEFGPPGVERFDAAAARESFRAGQVAMLIDRAERLAAWSGGKPIGVAALPGSERVFEPLRKEWKPESPPNRPSYLPRGGGWLIGISNNTQGTQREAAIDFAKYLASPDNSESAAQRAELFRCCRFAQAQLGQGLVDPTSVPDVDAQQWAVAVASTLQADRVVPGLRVHGAGGYLSDLSKGENGGAEAACRRKPRPQSLAKAWTERTKELGPSASSGITVAA